jgi:hypothetical protein
VNRSACYDVWLVPPEVSLRIGCLTPSSRKRQKKKEEEEEEEEY